MPTKIKKGINKKETSQISKIIGKNKRNKIAEKLKLFSKIFK